MSVAAYEEDDSERDNLAGELYKAKKLKIAENFRENVLLRTGFSAFRLHFRKNTACYRLGWVLSRRLNSLLSPFLQSLSALPKPASPRPQTSPQRTPRGPLTARITEIPIKSGENNERISEGSGRRSEISGKFTDRPSVSKRVRKSTKLITQLVVGKKVIERLGRLVVKRAFLTVKRWGGQQGGEGGRGGEDRSPREEFRRRVADSPGRLKATASDSKIPTKTLPAEVSPGELTHTEGIQLKSERLSQRVSSILKLIETRKASPPADEPQYTPDPTPKRNLNLRIPNPSSASTSPFSPESTKHIDSGPQQRLSFDSPRDSYSQGQITIKEELQELDGRERRVRVWKGWKNYYMRVKAREMKVAMGVRNSRGRTARKVLDALGRWKEYRTGKRQWTQLAASHYSRSLTRRAFLLFTVTYIASQHKSTVFQLHSTRLLHRILSFWSTHAKATANRHRKVTAFSSQIAARIKYKYIAIWKFMRGVLSIRRNNSEKALFCWYANAMPKLWDRMKKGVKIAKIERKMREIAMKIRRKMLISRFVPLWHTAILSSKRTRAKEAKVWRNTMAKRAQYAINRLISYSKSRKSMKNKTIFAVETAKRRIKRIVFHSFQSVLADSKRLEAISKKAICDYNHEISLKAVSAWRKWTKIRKIRERKSIQYRNDANLMKIGAFFDCWHEEFIKIASKAATAATFHRNNSLKSIFFAIKTSANRRISTRKGRNSIYSQLKSCVKSRLFANWQHQVAITKQHHGDQQAANAHRLSRLFLTWRKRYFLISALRKLLQTRFLRTKWVFWGKTTLESKVKTYQMKRAMNHYRKASLMRVFGAWLPIYRKESRYSSICDAVILKKRGKLAKTVVRKWVETLPYLHVARKRAKIGSVITTAHFRALLLRILREFQSSTRKIVAIRKKTSLFLNEKAMFRLHAAVERHKIIGRSSRLLLKKAGKHLENTRKTRGFTALLKRFENKRRIVAISVTAVRKTIISGLNRWKAYQKRYLSLRKRANTYRNSIETRLKQATISLFLQFAQRNQLSKRHQQRLDFYIDRRIGRILAAWKAFTQAKLQSLEEIYRLQDFVTAKAYFKSLRLNLAYKKRVEIGGKLGESRRRKKLLMGGFAAIRYYAKVQVRVEKGKSRHCQWWLKAVFGEWRTFATVSRYVD